MSDKKIIGEQGLRTLLTSIKDNIDKKVNEKVEEKTENISWNTLKDKPFNNYSTLSAFCVNLEDGVSDVSVDLTSPNSYWVGYDLDDEGNVVRECKLNSTILDGKVYLTYTYGLSPGSWSYQFCAVVNGKTLTIIEHDADGWRIDVVAQKYYEQLDSQYLALNWEANEGESGYLCNKPFGHIVIEKDVTLFGVNNYDRSNPYVRYFRGSLTIDTNTVEATINCNSEYNTHPFCMHGLCDAHKYFELNLEASSYVSIPIGTVQFKYEDDNERYVFSSNWDDGDGATIRGNIRRVPSTPSYSPYSWYLTFDSLDINHLIGLVESSEYSNIFTDNGDGTYSFSFRNIYATMKCDILKKIDSKFIPYEEFTKDAISDMVDELIEEDLSNLPGTFKKVENLEIPDVDVLPHFLYTPITPRDNLPLIVVLHSSLLKGKGLDYMVTSSVGAENDDLPKFLYEGRLGNIDAYILMPQTSSSRWTEQGETLRAMVEHYAQQLNIDTERIVITGWSMGATGSLELASAYPSLYKRVLFAGGCLDGVTNNRIPYDAINKCEKEVETETVEVNVNGVPTTITRLTADAKNARINDIATTLINEDIKVWAILATNDISVNDKATQLILDKVIYEDVELGSITGHDDANTSDANKGKLIISKGYDANTRPESVNGDRVMYTRYANFNHEQVLFSYIIRKDSMINFLIK